MRYFFGLAVLLLIFVASCKKSDNAPPVIFMNGADTVTHILNNPYNDAGATATDDKDGNITNEIFVENLVNENKVGWYTVTYKVVDEAGNEAAPAIRSVFVYNEGYIYIDEYKLTDIQKYPDQDTCSYTVLATMDSTVNYRIVFSNFACSFGLPVYADLSEAVILIPFQVIADSVSTMAIQGNGSVNDTLMKIDYTINNDTITSLWEAEFLRMKK